MHPASVLLFALAAWSLAAAAWGQATATANTRQLLRAPRIEACHIGFDGHYKLGHWTPLRIRVRHASVETIAPTVVEVIALDSDGVATRVARQISKPESPVDEYVLYTKAGRTGSPLRVRLTVQGTQVDEWVLPPGSAPAAGPTTREIPATAQLLLGVAPTPFGLAEAAPNRAAGDGLPSRHVVSLTAIDDLPAVWYGYEGVDLLILSAGDGSLLRALAADRPRLDALRKWLELGGKLVLIFGGRAGTDLLTAGAPLSSTTNLQVAELQGRLPDTVAVEHYAQSDMAIVAPGERSELRIAQLEHYTGRVELFGTGVDQAPLVIRSLIGFGELTFVGFDLDAAPLAEWPGRTAFLRNALGPLGDSDQAASTSRRLVTSGYDDVTGALRQRLAADFAGVKPVSFRAAAGLAILFILVIGPLDYWFVRHWLRRPRLAWLTLPVILLAFGGGALVFGGSRQPVNRPVLNRIELIDADVSSEFVRGTFWSSLYSPVSTRYDFKFIPADAFTRANNEKSLLSWQGLAGSGIGGMNSAGARIDVVPKDYLLAGDEMVGVPLLISSTKSLIARWSARSVPLVSAELQDDHSMLAGTLINRSELTLRNVRLLYGTWAYRWKAIAPGQSIDMSGDVNVVSLQTAIASDVSSNASSLGGERATLAAHSATAQQLLTAMLFYKAAGGTSFGGLPLRLQSYIDMSRQLELGQAVLFAELPVSGSQLVDGATGEPLGGEGAGTSITIYRVVIPVERGPE